MTLPRERGGSSVTLRTWVYYLHVLRVLCSWVILLTFVGPARVWYWFRLFDLLTFSCSGFISFLEGSLISICIKILISNQTWYYISNWMLYLKTLEFFTFWDENGNPTWHIKFGFQLASSKSFSQSCGVYALFSLRKLIIVEIIRSWKNEIIVAFLLSASYWASLSS